MASEKETRAGEESEGAGLDPAEAQGQGDLSGRCANWEGAPGWGQRGPRPKPMLEKELRDSRGARKTGVRDAPPSLVIGL